MHFQNINRAPNPHTNLLLLVDVEQNIIYGAFSEKHLKCHQKSVIAWFTIFVDDVFTRLALISRDASQTT